MKVLFRLPNTQLFNLVQLNGTHQHGNVFQSRARQQAVSATALNLLPCPDTMQDDMQMAGLSAWIDGHGMVRIAPGEFLIGASGGSR